MSLQAAATISPSGTRFSKQRASDAAASGAGLLGPPVTASAPVNLAEVSVDRAEGPTTVGNWQPRSAASGSLPSTRGLLLRHLRPTRGPSRVRLALPIIRAPASIHTSPSPPSLATSWPSRGPLPGRCLAPLKPSCRSTLAEAGKALDRGGRWLGGFNRRHGLLLGWAFMRLRCAAGANGDNPRWSPWIGLAVHPRKLAALCARRHLPPLEYSVLRTVDGC